MIRCFSVFLLLFFYLAAGVQASVRAVINPIGTLTFQQVISLVILQNLAIRAGLRLIE